ncbi:hypothetical protein BEWA_041810 [Theileria equi strain WA]|uniref:Uncharacterized protein n=1 Tax=Theileria equi strain WA TaxID=1537102 RepID=L1LG59_THEEQ|nr:hypothetical protein BEWA_041810 [Theileria equi strain WA]EKX74143.1 hypothetical protein BEWA_041810 [Theileria equi strain WA]|eukprot:XP_004833595.1 hypothetical protein BEWA_041810 [Theileria equi strain WA]
MTAGDWLRLNVHCNGDSGTCRCDKIGSISARKEVSPSNARGFVAYTHELKDGTPFTLKKDIGGDKLGDNGEDIEGVTKVSVYYWDADKDRKKPLVIKVIRKDHQSQPEYYYKQDNGENEAQNKDATTWVHHGYVEGTSLQTRLDDRNAAINNVLPFDIEYPAKYLNFSSHRTKGKGIESSGQAPQLNGTEYVTTSYKINGIDGNTGISRIEYKKEKIKDIIIPPGGQINGIRLYSNTGISPVPIMFEFMKSGQEESTWYYSKSPDGTEWQEVYDRGNTFYINGQPTEELAKKLDGLSCENYKAVTIDLSYGNSIGKGQACSGSKEQKITVTTGEIAREGIGKAGYTKYSIRDDSKLADIKFYLATDTSKENRKRVKSNALHFPMNGPVEIYTFYSDKHNPILIYLDDSKSNKKSSTGWYRMQSKGGYTKAWKKTSARLKGINKTEIDGRNLGCKQWNKFTGVLRDRGTSGLQECTQETAKLGRSESAEETEGVVSTGDQEDEEDEEEGSEYENSSDGEGPPEVPPQRATRGEKDGKPEGQVTQSTASEKSTEGAKGVSSDSSSSSGITVTQIKALDNSVGLLTTTSQGKYAVLGATQEGTAYIGDSSDSSDSSGSKTEGTHTNDGPDVTPAEDGAQTASYLDKVGTGRDPDVNNQDTNRVSGNSNWSFDSAVAGLGGLVAGVVDALLKTSLQNSQEHKLSKTSDHYDSSDTQRRVGRTFPQAADLQRGSGSVARTSQSSIGGEKGPSEPAELTADKKGEGTPITVKDSGNDDASDTTGSGVTPVPPGPTSTTTPLTQPPETTPPAPSEEPQAEAAGSPSPVPSTPPGTASSFTGVVETAATGSVLWTAFGSTSGTLAGSAATFFGGWKLYNRYKGDPWVRQI